jgi:hypothetical protein
LNFFYRILFNNRTVQVATEQATFRSTDQGRHWEKLDDVVSDFSERFAIDPELGIPVRDAGPLPDVAVNRTNGALYTVWQDDNGIGSVGVFIARSIDGGMTWSGKVPANPGSPEEVQAFLPTVAVNDTGQVGVLFYDFRNDVLGDDPLSTDVWLTVFTPDLAFQSEARLTPTSMDLRQSVITGGRGYFPGDYMGLDAAGDDFVAAFTLNNDLGLSVVFPQNNDGVFVDENNRTDIVSARVAP